jgi:DNA-binding NarL/FixJ family response regulator
MSDNAQRRLMLVEDDALVRETITLMLEDAFDVSAIDRASVAMAWLRDPGRARPALILLDCMLPGGGRDELLGEADALRIPVVLISGDPQQPHMQRGGRALLLKPFGRDTMLAAIGKALEIPIVRDNVPSGMSDWRC